MQKKDFEGLVSALAQLRTDANKCKADYGSPCSPEEMLVRHQCMCDLVDRLSERVSYLADAFYNHIYNGHLPPMKTPSQMEHALDVLGVGNDYQIYKPILSIASNKGVDAVVEYRKPIK
jgi:hypothetical protein